MEDRKTRHRVETRSGHVIVLADAHDIGVGIVGVDYRVLVRPVAVVRAPHFGDEAVGLRFGRRREDQKNKKYCRKIFVQCGDSLLLVCFACLVVSPKQEPRSK